MLALVAQAGSVLHLVLVQHVTCPEHGEWVHAESGGVPAALTAPAAEHSAPAVEKSTAEEPHGHDHCSVTCTRRDEAVFTGHAVSTATCSALTEAPALSRAVFAPAIALLHLAPKASPPA